MDRSTSSSFRLVSWHTLLVGAVTAALVWWFLRSVSPHELWQAIRSAQPGLVAAAVGVTGIVYVVRTWRWQALLRPLGRASFRNAFRTTVIGFSATFLLPGRLGEVLRPYLLARAEGFSVPATFATVVVERVLDLVTVLGLFACFLVESPLGVGRDVKLGGAMAGLAALAALGVLLAGAGHPERLGRWAGRLGRFLPARASAVVSSFVRTFAEGLAVMRRPWPLVAALGLSLLLWLAIALGIWLTSLAFHLTFAFSGSFLIMMFLVVGVAVPTPAGIGSFHTMYRYAVTTFLGAPRQLAVAAAIVLHAVSFVPISLLGLVFMAQDGLSLARLTALAPAAGAAEASPASRPAIGVAGPEAHE